MQRVSLFIFAIFLVSCNTAQKRPSESPDDQTPIDSAASEAQISLSIGDTFRVYKKCAVFYTQDSVELEKRRREMARKISTQVRMTTLITSRLHGIFWTA